MNDLHRLLAIPAGSVAPLERVRRRRRTKVYAMQRPNRDIKIGVSDNPLRRRAEVQRQQGQPVKLLGFTPAPVMLEPALHRLLAPERKDGEWFAPTPRAQLVARKIALRNALLGR